MKHHMVNRHQWLCRAAGAGLASIGLLCGTSVLARADDTNTLTIIASCSNGQTLTAQIAGGNGAFPSALRVVDSTSVFTIHQFTATSPSGQTLFISKNDPGVANNHDLVSCSHKSTTGNLFTWTGFFTPAP
jgi:hypothetical protein